MRPDRANYSYDLILDQVGDRWPWRGMMTHNYYAVDDPGSYAARYEVYVGDAVTGAADTGWTPQEVTLRFTAVPEPATWLLGTTGASLLFRARRR